MTACNSGFRRQTQTAGVGAVNRIGVGGILYWKDKGPMREYEILQLMIVTPI